MRYLRSDDAVPGDRWCGTWRQMLRYLWTDDAVPGDVLRFLGEDGLRTVIQLIDELHEPGEWPKDFTDYIDYLGGG